MGDANNSVLKFIEENSVLKLKDITYQKKKRN